MACPERRLRQGPIGTLGYRAFEIYFPGRHELTGLVRLRQRANWRTVTFSTRLRHWNGDGTIATL